MSVKYHEYVYFLNSLLLRYRVALDKRRYSENDYGILQYLSNSLFLPRDDATQSAVMPQHVVCPSVYPFVNCDVQYRDHIGWSTP